MIDMTDRTDVPHIPIDPVVERLTAIRDRDHDTLDYRQMLRIVQGVAAGEPLADTADAVGIDRQRVIDAVGEFGTWLSHVHGAMPDTARNGAADGRRAATPVGYADDGREHNSNVDTSAATIAWYRPDRATLLRYVARRRPSPLRAITYPLLTLTHFFARIGRLSDLDGINPDNPTLAARLITAHDMLRDAANTSNRSVGRLLTVDVVADGDLDGTRDTLEQILADTSWAFEAELRPLARAVQHARDAEDSPALRAALNSSVQTLQGKVRARPSDWLFSEVGDISAAGVRRLAEGAGLLIEQPGRREVGRVRDRLRALGLGNDVDQLVDDALLAEHLGVGVEFWDAMARRADGDPTWETGLLRAYRRVAGGAGS